MLKNMSISPESTTNGGDITTDQQFFEELCRLQDRIKIALLEREEMINSLTSSASFDLLAQNGNVSVEQRLRAKIDELERRRKADQEEHNAKIDKKMEEYKEEQQQKMNQYKKEQQQKMKQYKKEQQRKMEEDQQKQQQKMEEYKEEQQQKMEEYKEEQQQKMNQYKEEQQQKMKQYKKEQQRKMEEDQQKQQQKMEEYKEEQQQKMEEYKEEQQQKMEEYKEEQQQKMNQYKEEQQQKMKQYKKEQQQKMEYQRQQKVEYQRQQQEKMEGYQRQQQQAIDVLTEKQKGLTIQNRWDSDECHRGLALSGPDRSIVHYNGKEKVSCSVLAERPISKGNVGIFYYEVKILRIKCYIYVGLAPKQMPLNKTVGEFKGSYAYSGSRGHFFGHVVEGCSQIVGRPYIEGIPSFGVSDVIGCGVDLATRQIIYTKNGQRLETAGLFVDSAAELFPCVTLLRNGDKIEANFGPNFEYKF